MNTENEGQEKSIVWTALNKIAISSERAQQIAEQYAAAARKSNHEASQAEIESIVAQKVISKYARTAALSGGATALPGVIPGVGTAVAVVGGGLTDATFCLKNQVDMTIVLAANFGWDVTEQDARYMAMLIAVCGSLEKLGATTIVPVASKAGVKMLKQYLKGGALIALKSFTKSFGVAFSRKALEKSVPFGVGAAFGTYVNYRLTRYVGSEAVKCFVIERQERVA